LLTVSLVPFPCSFFFFFFSLSLSFLCEMSICSSRFHYEQLSRLSCKQMFTGCLRLKKEKKNGFLDGFFRLKGPILSFGTKS
jgi:hypothetical protein